MAFIKMKNALGTIISVPRSAVKAYEGLGFVIDGKEAAPVKTEEKVVEKEAENVEDTSEDEQFVQELEKKPLPQWTKDEVKRYATIREVDISGTKNAQEAKERIKAFIDNLNE